MRFYSLNIWQLFPWSHRGLWYVLNYLSKKPLFDRAIWYRNQAFFFFDLLTWKTSADPASEQNKNQYTPKMQQSFEFHQKKKEERNKRNFVLCMQTGPINSAITEIDEQKKNANDA